MGMTNQAWSTALQSMLPPGRAFTRAPDSVLSRLLGAIAAMLTAAQLWLEGLLVQADPRRATSLLQDWERLLGLPDATTPAGLQTVDRQLAAFGRLTEVGGQSRPYYIELAARNGEPGCTITNFRPANCNSNCNAKLYSQQDIFTWRVNVPHPPQEARMANCNSNCNAALQMYKPSVIEALFTKRKAAETLVIFSYQ